MKNTGARLRVAALLLAGIHVQYAVASDCLIGGFTVNATTGTAVPAALVYADPVAGGTPAAVVTSDASGRFCFNELSKGDYWIRGRRNGFLESYVGATRYGQKGTPLTVSVDAPLAGVALRLFVPGTITGRVLDPEGEPLLGARVSLFRVSYSPKPDTVVVEEASTDPQGRYGFYLLPPGQYFVRASPGANGGDGQMQAGLRLRLLETFYPGSVSASESGRIRVRPADVVTGTDISLVRSTVVHVRGVAAKTITFPLAQGGGFGFTGPGELQLKCASQQVRGAPRCLYRAYPDPKGAFMFDAVPQGSYVLSLLSPKEFAFANAPHFERPLDVGPVDLEGVTLLESQDQLVTGTVIDTKRTPANGLTLGFASAEDPLYAFADVVNGTFSVSLPPGRYFAYVRSQGRWLVRNVMSAGRDALEDGFLVQASGEHSLEIVVTEDAGALVGTLAIAGSSGVAAGSIILAAPAQRAREHLYRHTLVDSRGSWRLEALPSGNYTLWAFEGIQPGQWLEPGFLEAVEQSGQKIVVGTSEQRIEHLALTPLSQETLR